MNLAASIQEKVKGLLPDLLGIEFTDVTPDKVVARLAVRKDLCTVGDNLHGGAPAGTRVVGESVPVHKGRTTVVCQTTIRSEAGKLVALVTQTQLVIAPAKGV